MRFLIASMLLAACTVPDKNSSTDAGPGDAPGDVSDPTAPDTTILSAPAEFSGAGAATFEFESNVAGSTFECSIDEETPVPCSSPYTRTLNDGPHGIVVRAISPSGNSDDTPAEHRWTIDTVVPDTVVTEKPPAFDNSVEVMFDFEASEENVVYECSTDGGAFATCAPDDLFGPFGDGPHSFGVRARDRAGNVDTTPAVYAWTIDTTMPDTQIIGGPADVSGSTSATFSFISPDAGPGATFDCSLDGAAFTPCTSPMTFNNLGERMHTFMARVRDSVGNLDPTPATREWMVDLSAPNTTISSGPTGTVATASASFVFTSSEEDSTFECQDDGGAFTACTSPHTVMMLSQGPHSFAVRAIDAAGHADASPATASWTVDTIAPAVSITAGPAMDSTSGPYVTFTFSVSEGTSECSVDGAAFAACTSPVSFNANAAPHQFRVRATDAAGNTGMEIRTWTIACAPPAPTGAAGLLHLDDGSQSQPNETGGPAAILGDDVTVEPADPAAGAGRFGGGLSFGGAQHLSWPLALGATSGFAVELWSQPAGAAGTHVVFVSGDGRIAIRVAGAGATVRYSVSVISANSNKETTVTSADVAAGAWHHVVASLEEPTLRLWVDGVRTQAGGVSLMSGPLLDAVRLGDNYTGSLDEVWVASSPVVTDDDARSRYCPL